MISLSLIGDQWTVEGGDHGPLAARVPGCVHDALEAAGVLPPADAPGGEAAQSFVGRTDWLWKRVFNVDEAVLEQEHVELVFDSIDCVGEVFLNGQSLGKVYSQFVPLRFDVKNTLRCGVNELELRLVGPLAEAERLEALHGKRPVNADGAWGPFSQLRKSACNFGWDWGPCCPTTGVAGEVALEAWCDARIVAIRPGVLSADSEEATLRVCVDTEPRGVAFEVIVRSEDGAVLASGTGAESIELSIENPPLWWPREMGSQHLVFIEVVLAMGARAMCRTGLRTVALESTDDGRFAICVNGKSVFCRGANWIPSRLFPHGQTVRDVEGLLEAACEANMNMIRVWGGGVYEPSFFYDRCDELGLLVWQDFMFACATYSQREDMVQLVREEAHAQVARLSRHPSLALWCGGNEDILAWFSWGWQDQLSQAGMEEDWGERYWLEELPAIVQALDPTRPYWAESPYSGALEVHPNDPDRGDRHTWDLKLDAVRDMVPRFVSEFGHQAPPTILSIEEAFDAPIDQLSVADLAPRQRAWGGDEVQYKPFLDEYFGAHDDWDLADWVFACQLLQARAMSMSCFWLRANRPRCEGALIWQLNDVWTGHSWSLLDVNGRPKPAYFAVRRAFAPRALTIEPFNGVLHAVMLNETNEEFVGDAVVRRMRFDGETIAEEQIVLSGACPLPDSITSSNMPECELIDIRFRGLQANWFFAKDRDLALPSPKFTCHCNEQLNGSALLTIQAHTLLRDLHIREHASDGHLTLLPGDTAIIPLNVARPNTPPIIQTANHLQ